MNYQTLQLAFEGGIARITLSRPDTANRVDQRLLRELAQAAQEIGEREGVVLTLLQAQGADFCAGWDEAVRESLMTSRRDTTTLDPFGVLATLSCPVVASMQGRVSSAGLELALTCDIRIAAADARFDLPEVALGTLPLAGGSQRLPRSVGRSRAAAMLLLGEELDAEAALRCGLVSRAVPTASLPAETEALVQRIAGRGPIALRYAKEAVHNGIEMSLAQALRYELDLSIILQTTSDRDEGVQAFLEKRPPEFRGS